MNEVSFLYEVYHGDNVLITNDQIKAHQLVFSLMLEKEADFTFIKKIIGKKDE